MSQLSRKYIPTALAFLIAVLCLLSSCKQTETPSQPAPARAKNEIAIAALGDVMMPKSIQAAMARNKNNYDLLFEKIAPDLAGSADITFANLETPVDHKAPSSGYPKFNARPELLAALKKIGVTIVSTANNHAMDAGVSGLKRTLDNVQAAGLVFVGAGRTKAEATEIRRLTAKDISVAFLAYTYSTNERLPRKKPSEPGVNILRPKSRADLDLAVEQVKQARPLADLVVVSLHWGDEYKSFPTRWQKKAASELIEAGADIIFGHHPHVLQPIEVLTAKNGRRGIVAYSLGNFISSQNYGISFKNKNHSRASRGDGIVLTVFAVKEHGTTSISRVEYLPIWTVREKTGKTVMTRPVSIAREIGRLNAMTERSAEEENLLKLLSFRQKVIVDKLSPRPQ